MSAMANVGQSARCEPAARRRLDGQKRRNLRRFIAAASTYRWRNFRSPGHSPSPKTGESTIDAAASGQDRCETKAASLKPLYGYARVSTDDGDLGLTRRPCAPQAAR